MINKPSAPADRKEYCAAIASILCCRRSSYAHRTKQWMESTLDALKRADNINDYAIASEIDTKHKWVIRISVQPNPTLEQYDFFFRLTQDDECSFIIRERKWGYGTQYDRELREFLGIEKPRHLYRVMWYSNENYWQVCDFGPTAINFPPTELEVVSICLSTRSVALVRDDECDAFLHGRAMILKENLCETHS